MGMLRALNQNPAFKHYEQKGLVRWGILGRYVCTYDGGGGGGGLLAQVVVGNCAVSSIKPLAVTGATKHIPSLYLALAGCAHNCCVRVSSLAD